MPTPDLLARPHHDGSALYVDRAAPAPGERVTVRVRVPHGHDIDQMHVRQVTDGEPEFSAARITSRTATDTWWSADVVCHNPVTSYRFIMSGPTDGYLWLNAAGLSRRDVPDVFDFRLTTFGLAPDWARHGVVYQVFPDRFAKAVDRPAPEWAEPADWSDPVDTRRGHIGTQWYGGDLAGVQLHLHHLERLGVTTLYLTPVFPARSNHRYDAATFDAVDPVLGGDEAFASLVRAAHARGLRVLGDITTNHTGVTHDWFIAASADPAAPQRDHYFFDEQGDYEKWLGVPSLPKLNHASPTLREELFDRPEAPVRRWLAGDSGLDGWRVDVANMTGRLRDHDVNHEVAAHMRATVVDVKPDAYLVGEHAHDHYLDASGEGWHGVMNYSGFTRPVWTWLRDKDFAPSFLGNPLMVPRLGGPDVVDTMTEFNAMVPWSTRRANFNLVGSHDTTRVRTLVGADTRQVGVALTLVMAMPGIPMITYGDEIGMEGAFAEDGRRPMPWHESDWDSQIFDDVQQLVAARRDSVALRDGGLRWVRVEDDTITFLREVAGESVLVHVARDAGTSLELDEEDLPGIGGGRLLAGRGISADGSGIRVETNGPGFALWLWKDGGRHGEAL